ncbi:MAG: hypothetical protein MUE78_08820 [Ilumatobacteraceae bacterium]|jgi:hypothetical protein|nr:hypothetical protein [Ilumatobacteraceae bacterium]
MDLRRELHRLVDDALDHDPRRALIAVRLLADEHQPWLEERAVLTARAAGWSWARIGRLLGRTRQAVRVKHQHLSPVMSRPADDPLHRQLQRLAGTSRRLREFESDDVVGW